jgi:VWFA-related protein
MQPQRKSLRTLFAVLLVASPSTAQTPAPRTVPRFEGTVALVTLPVFVTDKDGKPVAGLTAADFEATDDGKPATIAGLQEIDVTEALPAAASALPSVQAAARRQFLFLFDLSFSNPAGIVRARQAALKFAQDGLAASDLAGVATFSVNTGVRLLLGLTTDRVQFARAVDTLGVLQVQRTADPLALTYELSPEAAGSMMGGGGDAEWVEHIREQVLSMKRGEDQQYAQRVNDYLGGLQRLARGLDAVRGRKQVILLSGGFDQTALMGSSGEQARQDSAAVVEGRLWEVDTASRFGDAKARSFMDDMVKAFAAADAVVHAVDVNGLAARGDVGESMPGVFSTGGREALSQIANLTGGRLVKDTNDVAGALGQVVEASRRYYVLALEPVAKGPGKFHRLKVRVKGRGLEVSHRTGYVEPSPAATAAADAQTRRLQAAEAIAKGLTGGEIDVRLVAVPYRDAQGRLSLPVVMEVDGESLVPPTAKGELPLEVYGYAFDDKGGVVDLMALTPTLTLEKLGARVRESGLQFHTAFAVKPGAHDLRFLVRDASTGRMGSRRLAVTVPPFASGATNLSAPLVMADPAQRVVLQTPSRNNPTPEMPFRVDADLFTPQGRPRLANGRTDSVCVLAFSPTPFDAKSAFQISAHLTDAAGARVPLGAPLALARVVGEPDGFRRFVLKMTPTGVPAGEYTLRVRVKDPLAADAAETAQTIRVQ